MIRSTDRKTHKILALFYDQVDTKTKLTSTISGASRMRVGALGICRLSFALALAGRIVSESRAGTLLPGASGDKGSRSFASASTSWKLKTLLLNIRDREEGDSRDEKVVPPISPADDREI